MIWVELAAGLVLLLGGGEALVKGSVAAASRLGVSPLLIGLTLVGFGTSTPELVASLDAALIGSPGIAIGNIVGSNIANILLILGISAVIWPLVTTKDAFRRDGSVLIGTSVALAMAVTYGSIGRGTGIVFLLLLVTYTVYTYWSERRAPDAAAAVYAAEAAEVAPRPLALPLAIGLAMAGIATVVIGADLLVQAAIVVAEQRGLSETVIGLTLVAVGTSLPELVTSVVAAIRRHGDVAFGNIVGSNIFNALGIAGVTAVVAPLEVPVEIARFDIWVMVGTGILLVVFATTGWRLSRREGGFFLLAYALYIGLQLSADF